MLFVTKGISFFFLSAAWNSMQQRKKGGAPTLWDSRDGPREHCARRNKPGGEGQIPYDLTYKWDLSTKQTSKQNITRDIEIKNKLTVTRGEGVEG